MSDLAKVDLLRRVADAFNRHDLDAIMAAFSDDCVFESPRGPDPWGKRFVGKDQVRQDLAPDSRGFRTCTTAAQRMPEVRRRWPRKEWPQPYGLLPEEQESGRAL